MAEKKKKSLKKTTKKVSPPVKKAVVKVKPEVKDPDSMVTVLAKVEKNCRIGETYYKLAKDELDSIKLCHAEYLEDLGVVKIIKK
jgi:hypothetical protein